MIALYSKNSSKELLASLKQSPRLRQMKQSHMICFLSYLGPKFLCHIPENEVYNYTSMSLDQCLGFMTVSHKTLCYFANPTSELFEFVGAPFCEHLTWTEPEDPAEDPMPLIRGYAAYATRSTFVNHIFQVEKNSHVIDHAISLLINSRNRHEDARHMIEEQIAICFLLGLCLRVSLIVLWVFCRAHGIQSDNSTREREIGWETGSILASLSTAPIVHMGLVSMVFCISHVLFLFQRKWS